MPQSRTRSRAAMRSKYRKPKRRRSGSTAWTAATVAIVVVLVGVLVLTVLDRNSTSGANTAPRYADQASGITQDHWHMALNVDVCGEWLADPPEFLKPFDNPGFQGEAGLHTHGDGLIHIEPTTSADSGTNATVGRFLGYGGFDFSADSIDLGGANSTHPQWPGPASAPKQTTWKTGDTCPFGQYKGQKVDMTWYVDGKQVHGNPGDLRLENGETLAGYLLPKGAPQPFPPTACAALAKSSGGTGASPYSKSSPCRATTTTTVPGETTTTAPTTTSTP